MSDKMYKTIISILFGLIGFVLNFFGINLFEPVTFKITLLPGLLFPLLIALVWGWRYALLAAAVGGCQSMWFLWASDGWGILYSVPVYTAWVVWHGYWADARRSNVRPRWFRHMYFVELPFRLVSEIGFYTLFPWLLSFNPAPWSRGAGADAVNMSWLNTVSIKHLVLGYVLLIIAHVLLCLKPVRRLFHMDRSPEETFSSTKERLEYMNRVLRAIRNVNQLITTEDDEERLLHEACRRMVETQGYYNTWIVRFDGDGKKKLYYEAKIHDEFDLLENMLEKEEYLPCVTRGLNQAQLIAVKDPLEDCSMCPFCEHYAGRGAFAKRLEYRGKTFGMITTSVPNWYVDDTEERELFEEVAGDISYALYNCERERERKKAEDEVKKELQEKEVLLREIHHRVKNNLNIVSSLLSLQSDQIETVPQAKEAFRKSRTRIHSMALVHNNLYRKETLSHVGLPFYIETLIADVSGIYDSEHHIHIDTDIEDLTLNIDLALPVGLIVNELVTNALKYAFPQEKKGEVAVSLHPVNNTDCQLRVKDNGVGLPADVDIHSSETLGLQLVNVLAEQLGGTLELKNELGTELILEFPLIK